MTGPRRQVEHVAAREIEDVEEVGAGFHGLEAGIGHLASSGAGDHLDPGCLQRRGETAPATNDADPHAPLCSP